MHRTHNLLVAALACACLPASAHATPAVTLHATLTPERLGQSTAVGFGLQIAGAAGKVPPPLTAVDMLYPENLGIATSGLGLATCSPATLETLGVEGCPADSRMGYGAATAVIPINPEEINLETANITLVQGPLQAGYLSLLLYADAMTPVSTQIVLPGLLLPAPAPFGGHIDIEVPLVPSVPGAPDVAMMRLHATIGPQHLTYYERIHGKIVAYRPKGILLPTRCPHGGFPFAAELSFEDGSHVTAHTAVPCPARKQQHQASV